MAIACPGPVENFSYPERDADTNPPDAAYDAEAGPPQPVKVMNWNTRNFFNDKRDSPTIPVSNTPNGTCDPNLTAPCELVLSPADYQTKLTQVSSVISKIGPDVVMLQEIENKPVIDDLAQKLGGYAYRYVTQGNDPRGINIAVLSNLELQIGPSHKGEFFKPSTDPSQTFVFARDVLEAHFVINGRHLALLGIHFKAQDSDPATSDLKRLAEAEQTRRIADGILQNDPNTALAVLGDFNCTPGSDPMNALAGQAPNAFASATAGLAAGDRFSVSYSGIGPELFDDQIMSPNAAPLLDAASVHIVHDDADANATSDHDPVYATYELH